MIKPQTAVFGDTTYATVYDDPIAVYCFKSAGAWYKVAACPFQNFKNGQAMSPEKSVAFVHVTNEEIGQLCGGN